MSIGLIWLIIMVIAPIGLIYLLRSNAAMVFFGLCLGYVLYSFDSKKAKSLSLNHSLSIGHLKSSTLLVDLLLLLGPAIFTLVSQIKSAHGSKRLVNLVPSLFVGLFTPLIMVPVLPRSITSSIVKNSLWLRLTKDQAVIVGVGAAIALIFFLINTKEFHKPHHKVRE